MTTYDVLIIGAGNLGLWTAYQLARQTTLRIAVCDRSWAGWGATSRSAGIVRQQGGSVTAVKLGQWSRELYSRVGQELGLDSGFHEVGYYVLAETAAEKAAFLELVELRRACGLDNEWLDPAEGARRFPALNWDRFVGATYTASDGYVHPPIVARNITLAVLQAGVTILEKCPVEAIEPHSQGYRVQTAQGVIEAGLVVNAGGPRGVRAIGQLIDLEVPVAASRHMVMTFPTSGAQLTAPFPMWFWLAAGIYARPEEQGILLGLSNPAEAADRSERYQLSYDTAYVEQMRPAWEAILPALAGQTTARTWAASIDYTPDHLPIIDEPRPGFYVLAAGGHGMMWGPGLGLKMAELISQGELSELPADEVRLVRFQQKRRVQDAIALPFPTA